VQLTGKRLGGPSLGGMLATRRGALALALLCALVATGILLFAIGKYKHAVVSPSKQDTVLVASSEIHQGTAGALIASQQLYKVTPVLATQVSAGAITNAASLAGKVAASNIFAGAQLTAADFTVAGGGSLVGELTPTERAVAVTLDPAHGTGVLQTGDHVDVYGSFSAGSSTVVSLLVPNAVVLKASSGATSTGSVLLGVSMTLSPRIMWVFDNGKIWLELRGLNATSPAPTITGDRQNILGNYLAATPTYPTHLTTGAKR
jgi:Flp pilus assembly protein CpaB